jgi:hypothetical protein
MIVRNATQHRATGVPVAWCSAGKDDDADVPTRITADTTALLWQLPYLL